MVNQKLFVALALTGCLPTELVQLYKKIRTTADRSETLVKWSPLENLHITLVFLGETPIEKREKLEKVLAQLAEQSSSFELNIGDVGAFPDEIEARVIWIGVQNKIVLRELRSQVITDLAGDFAKSDEHEFTPHITIGRVRSKQSVRKVIEPFRRKQVGKINIVGFSLFESIQAGSFPIYKELRRFEFKHV